MKEYKKLYKFDENNNTRIWYMQKNANQIRVCSGILNGKIVESGWKTCFEKNVGKSNYVSDEDQAEKEIEAKYTKQLKSGGYYKTIVEAEAKYFRFHSPMLAQPHEKIKHDISEYLSQPKSDGIRAITDANDIKTRKGEAIVSCDHIKNELQTWLKYNKNIVFDGELYNHDYKDDFNSIQSSVTTKKGLTDEKLTYIKKVIQYHVYDFFDLDNPNIPNDERVELLTEYLKKFDSSIIKLVPTIQCKDQNHADTIYENYILDGYEGQMLRYTKAIYQHKRTFDLIKVKEFMDKEFLILDVIEGEGNWAGYAKSLKVRFLDSDIVFHSGIKGNQKFTKHLLTNKEKFVNTIVTINYQMLTPDGIPRFPVAVKFWGKQRNY